MRIDGMGRIVPNVRSDRTRDLRGVSQGTEGRVGVRLSERAEEMRVATRGIRAVPDVRQERIDRIRREVSAGRYVIDAEAIAERMLDLNGL